MQPGAEPADFTFWRTGQGESGKWTVVADRTAANGRAIAQISKDRTDYRFPLAVYQPFSGKNLEISVRFKPVAGTVDEAGGVVLRLLTPDDYYVARANGLEDNVRFYRVVKGKREQLAGANTKVSANQWHTLAFKAEGDRFTVSFDGKVLISLRVFGWLPGAGARGCTEAGVRKASREETAGGVRSGGGVRLWRFNAGV